MHDQVPLLSVTVYTCECHNMEKLEFLLNELHIYPGCLQYFAVRKLLPVSLKLFFKEVLGMEVVSVSSSAARTPLGLSLKFATQRSTSKRPLIVAFKVDKSTNSTAMVAPHEKIPLPIEAPTKIKKGQGKGRKSSKRVKAVCTDEASSPSTLEMDYNEAAAKLESIYKLSPSIKTSDAEDTKNP